jgi:hypothetical protein
MGSGRRSSSTRRLEYASPSGKTYSRRGLDLSSLIIGIGFEVLAVAILWNRAFAIGGIFAIFGVIWLLFSVRLFGSDE